LWNAAIATVYVAGKNHNSIIILDYDIIG
jgi:hypothetical protein